MFYLIFPDSLDEIYKKTFFKKTILSRKYGTGHGWIYGGNSLKK